MKKLLILLTLLLIVPACGTAEGKVAEPAANVASTAVLPTPTLNSPRLNEEPASPTAVPTQPPVIPETASTEPASAPELAATETAVPVPVVEEVVAESGGIGYGRTPEGAFYHGDPNAPITMIDFSDFL